MGLGVVGASYTNKSESKLTETTPIAKLIEEPGAIMVSKDSPYKTIDDLVDGLEEGPIQGHRRRRLLARAAPTTSCRCSSPGAVGIDADEGQLRLLRRRRRPASGASSATSWPSRPPAPVSSSTRSRPATSASWRPAARARSRRRTPPRSRNPASTWSSPTGAASSPLRHQRRRQATRLIDTLDQDARVGGWKEALKTRGWTDAFATGDEFKSFLTDQDKRVADVLTKLGLA